MTLKTCLSTDSDNYVIITEYTDGEQYLPEGSSLTAKNRYEYTDTTSVDVFVLNSTDGTSYSPYVLADRSEDTDTPQIRLEKDGWFTSIHIVIPNKNWVYKELSKEGSIINTYDTVYCSDGKDIYICTDGALTRTTLQTLIDEDGDNTTISRVDTDHVSITLMLEELVSQYTAVMENRMYNGGCSADTCTANRLTHIVNLVRHYVRIGQLAEAERIIEKAGFFSSATGNKKGTKRPIGCGCL